MIRRYFFTGLALLLPAVITIFVVSFLINILTKPFEDITKAVLSRIGLFNLMSEEIYHLFSKFLIVFTLGMLLILTGIFAQAVVARYFIRLGDYIIHKIPLVNKIYKATQDVVHTVFKEEQAAFSQVVLVPFPHTDSYSIGLITGNGVKKNPDNELEGLVSVFLPATPNPTMGFLLLFQRNQLILVDMKVEDALKAIISCGVMIKAMSRS